MATSDPPAQTTPDSRPGPQAVTELARDMKLFDITMVGVGAMIGAGIFALTGIAAGQAGPALLLAFALNGVLTLCTAMVYAEVGSAIPAAGGGYLWARFGLPGPCAFLAGWMDWLAHAVAIASMQPRSTASSASQKVAFTAQSRTSLTAAALRKAKRRVPPTLATHVE